MTVLSIDDAMSHLNMADVDESELASMIEAAEAAIAKRVGPLVPTAVTSVVDSGGGSFTLPLLPVISLTSVAVTYPFGYPSAPFGATGMSVNGATGVVSSSSSALPAGRYTVEYVAGRTELSADLLMAIKEMVRHLWKSQRGAAARPGSADSAPAAGYLIPNSVAELLAPHRTFGFGLA